MTLEIASVIGRQDFSYLCILRLDKQLGYFSVMRPLAFTVLLLTVLSPDLLNLTTTKNAVSIAVQHCSQTRDNAALTINNSLNQRTVIPLCQCILQFHTHHEEIDGLITV